MVAKEIAVLKTIGHIYFLQPTPSGSYQNQNTNTKLTKRRTLVKDPFIKILQEQLYCNLNQPLVKTQPL